MKRLVVFGCGYSATRFVELHGQGFEAVAVAARSDETVAALKAEGLDAHRFDGGPLSGELTRAVAAATHVLSSVPTDDDGDPALAAAGDAFRAAPSIEWFGYLSTIGVYGDSQGRWVDETTPTEATSPRIARRIEAEQRWLALGRETGAAVQIFRLAGIYGPGRSAVDNLNAGTARRLVKPGQVFNRIHVDDIAAAIAAGVASPAVGPLINVTDDEPAPPQDVIAYAAGLMNLPTPPDIPFETADLPPMARSFYSSNKRVSNRVLTQELGVRLAFPTYREGIAALAR